MASEALSGTWLSLLPPLAAIGLAIALRQVLLALAAGVWVGASLLAGFDPFIGLLRTFDHYLVSAVADRDHAIILCFSLILGGMIGLITRSGGALGIAALVTRMANSARRGQAATWLMGLLVFFDDYANALLVGTSMRPITDRLRISREKLAFLVDATSAPIASVALFSSWIGVEVGHIAEQLKQIGSNADAYSLFLQSLPYRYYPLLMLYFGLLVALSGWDFGPMAKAEKRARVEGKVHGDDSTPASDFDPAEDLEIEPRWLNAALPITAVVIVAIVGTLFGGASSSVLLWASVIGSLVALAAAWLGGSLRFGDAVEAWVGGARSILFACFILSLAWSLNAVCRDLGTATFVTGAVGDWLPAALLPAAIFVIGATVSFATGTSFGTMAILFPLAIPLAHHLAPGDSAILLGAISSILAGAVWGDHCSPISDTTVMSSMASSCDHIEHVRTQLPYALLVGGVSLVCGEVASALGLYPGWLGLIVGATVLTAVHFGMSRGRRVPEAH